MLNIGIYVMHSKVAFMLVRCVSERQLYSVC